MPSSRLPLVVATALLAACSDGPSAPTPPTATDRASYGIANAPTDLRNVLRYTSGFDGWYVIDERAGLIALEGAPSDPRTFIACPGGTEGTSPVTHQVVRLRQGTYGRLTVGDDVTLFVYRLSDFTGDFLALICTQSPIAAGTGRIVVTDNDLLVNSGHVNSSGIHLQGTVTDVQSGETLRLTATARYVSPTTELNLIVSRVHLRAAGGRP